MDLRVASLAKADKVFFYTESTSAPLDKVMYFYPTRFSAINAASPSIKLVSVVDLFSHFVRYVCQFL